MCFRHLSIFGHVLKTWSRHWPHTELTVIIFCIPDSIWYLVLAVVLDDKVIMQNKISNHSDEKHRNQYTDFFIQTIPLRILQDLNRSNQQRIAFFYYISFISLFFYFFISNFESLRNQKFLSLSSNAGTCNAVLKPIDGIYLADTSGNWEGTSNFQYKNAIYSTTFNNFHGSDNDYRILLSNAFEIFDAIGNNAYKRDLAANLLYWMSYTVSATRFENKQSMSLTGTPEVVFDKRYLKGIFSNAFGVCDAYSKVTYDKKNHQLTIVFNYQQFSESPTCMDIINPTHMGYASFFDGSEFTIYIDVDSLVTAIAINSKILNASELEYVSLSGSTFIVDDRIFLQGEYFFPRFPGMKAMTCLANAIPGLPLLCSVRVGSLYTYPFFNHVGKNYTLPERCDCSNFDFNADWSCDIFNFLTGIVFYDYNVTSTESVNDLTRLVLAADVGYDVFNASFDAIFNSTKGDAEDRKEDYAFCASGNVPNLSNKRGCSVLTLFVGDDTFDFDVSDYNYQVREKGCSVTFLYHVLASISILTSLHSFCTLLWCCRSRMGLATTP